MERVLIALEKEKNSKCYDKDIAASLNLTPGNFASSKARNSIPFENIVKFCVDRELSLNYILYNQGKQEILKGDIGNTYMLPFYETLESEFFPIDCSFLEKLNVKDISKLIIKRVSGKAMEGTLQDHSLVIIDLLQKHITDGDIFNIRINRTDSIRRLEANPLGGINLISDNPILENINAPEENIEIVGKIVANISSF